MNGKSQVMINLLRGWPNASLLPATLIKAAAESALSDPAVYSPGLEYGPDPGYQPLRELVAAWLTRFYRPSAGIDAEQICITGGASQNLACMLQVYTDPLHTSKVWMVSPTYFLACRIFEDNGFHGQLRSVPEDEEGIDIEFLRKGLVAQDKEDSQSPASSKKLKPMRPWNKFYRHLIYAVPTFSNPSSKTMSLERRQQLVALARQHDALIISDDVYDQLQWKVSPSTAESPVLDQAVLPRLVDIDRILDGGTERPGADGFGNAMSNGSFSKIAGPGVRTGWAEGTTKFAYGLSQTGSSRSGGAPSQMTATFMSKLVEWGHLEKHIFHTLQPTYSRRFNIMIKAIEQHLVPLGIKLPQTDRDVVGGYFLWFSLPEPLDADDLAARALEEENLIIAQGSLFAVYGDEKTVDLSRCVRVCFSFEDEALLEEGIRRLAEVIRRIQRENEAASSVEELKGGNRVSGSSQRNGKPVDVGQYN